MLTKLAFFPVGHYRKRKVTALTEPMIKAIIVALDKQAKGIPFGPVDMKRPFTALIKRGLVQFEKVTIDNISQDMWRVTPEAIQMVKDFHAVGVPNSMVHR